MSFLYLTKVSKNIMTFIDRKTNGKFPGRKKRETNGIRPMRTDMSVVNQSDMYEGANMSNKGLRMSNSLVRISIILLLLVSVLATIYLIFRIRDSIPLFDALFWKIGLSVGGRPLSNLY